MKVASGIFRAESRNEVIYALDCGGAYGLIDAGGQAGLSAKLGQLASDGVDFDKIAAVFVTHCHEDHAGAIPKLRADRPLRVV
ncbi:MAG TPA: MBL fold metallo-hydrolase, partial [Armatimonadota bacterium]|nr:MBL fold metallo-hydrolase [Armatimonadota bacterium]